MKKLFISLLMALCTQVATATSIVILVTPKYIMIGTDSKRIFLDASGAVNQEEVVCKIRSVGKYCFALAGFTLSSATSFSADSIVRRNLLHATDYNQAVKTIKADIRKALVKELTYQREYQANAFRQISASKEPLLELVILSMQRGAPRMEIIGFQMKENNQIEIGSYTTHCPGDCPPQQQQLYFMGSYQAMEQHLPKQHFEKDPSNIVENLILVQSKATPSTVGAPVRIVKFSALGMEWIK